MRCPNCDHPIDSFAEPCPNCRFRGDVALIEELAHVDWALDELASWQALDDAARQQLEEDLTARQYDLEVALGLRLPRFTEEEAHYAWPDLFRRQELLRRLGDWLEAGLVRSDVTQTLADQTHLQVDDLLEQLEGHPRPVFLQTPRDRLDLIEFLLDAVDHLSQRDGFVAPQACDDVLSPLLEEQERLEIRLGLRPAPAAEPVSPPSDEEPTILEIEVDDIPPVTPPPPEPALPLGDRLWQTLLSERTLQGILFLGIFLLFAAALSFVVWGWKDFSALLRVAIPSGFTALFFVLGWFVRAKTRLYRSGIALSAIAALLIPIDFYTVYVNFDIPPDYWPLFWLMTSLACLAAYLVITLIIQNHFFGYLVGVATGSTLLALLQMGHQHLGLSLDWRSAGLSGLAVCFIPVAGAIAFLSARGMGRRLDVFAEPLRHLALLTAGVLMPLSFGWRYIGRDTFDTLHNAMTATWWLGGFIFGWGAIHYRSRSLGLLAAFALPVAAYMGQAALLWHGGINSAWHALGWALLVPLYFAVGHRLGRHHQDEVLRGHGRTAAGWGVVLLVVAALWSLTDLSSSAAAAVSHTVLAGAMLLAALLWRRPGYLYVASALSVTASTFGMVELGLTLSQLTLGWSTLAILHTIVALRVGGRVSSAEDRPSPDVEHDFTRPLVVAGYVIAGLALVPPLFPYDGELLAYALGSWLGLAAWGAILAHRGRPGFCTVAPRRPDLFHWLVALPLPVWLWLIFVNRCPPDFSLPLALTALAWGMVALSWRLRPARADGAYRWPWYVVGLSVSLAAPLAAFAILPDGFTPAVALLAVGCLWMVDAVVNRQAWELAPAGLVIAWGSMRLLDRAGLSFDALTLALALLIAVYFLAGLETERRRSPVFNRRFLIPLYLTTHGLTLVLLWRVYVRPFDDLFFNVPWTDEMCWWGAASQLVVGIAYGLFAWGTYKERWGHVAAWLGAASGGFIVIILSTGRGTSAAKAAVATIVFVMAERALYWLRQRGVRGRLGAMIRLAWPLYRRPLLVTGWAASAATIGMALIRNLWLLGGGRTRQVWAAVGLLLIVGLYALSARMFRRALFVWLAAVLVFAPWTILTCLGWFTVYRPTVPGYALGWTLLAWVLYLAGLVLKRFASSAYVLPLKSVAYVLLPFSLLWGVADVDTGRFTFGLAIGFCGLASVLDHHQAKRANGESSIFGVTKFIYPALGLIPVWCVYLMAWLLPVARHEHYGLMLLAFGPLGLVVGQWLRRLAPQARMKRGYAMPAYLTGYGATIVATMLVAHETSLLALVLLFDALLLVVSARLFKSPMWIYPAAAIVPVSLLLAVRLSGVPGNRHGWWLIGLAAVYLALAWALRRVRLAAYGTATLTVGLALIALGLPPSSQDQIGALWGYAGASLLYAIASLWLRQPLLLTPASALAVVPYAISLQRSALGPEYYGLGLFPGALVALAIGWGLDVGFGAWGDFPWREPSRWPAALADRLAGWWGLPLYVLGFGLAAASPLFTQARADLTALNFVVMMPLLGWAVYRFRLRVWLLAVTLAGHAAAIFYLKDLGWWQYPSWAWFRFLPVTLAAAAAAVFIERRRGEAPPLRGEGLLSGWSHPLYGLMAIDIVVAQASSLGGTGVGAALSLTHALLIAVLASLWLSYWMPYLSATLGAVSLVQWMLALAGPAEHLPVAMARLAVAYGLAGYGLTWIRNGLQENRELRPWLAIWEWPLQASALALSLLTLIFTFWLGVDLVGWTVRAILGFPFRQIVELATVRMTIGVFAWLGLLYVATAYTRRRLRLGYVAIGMLLLAWMFHAFYVQQWDSATRVQWYAIPAGLYLLGVAFMEWRQGNRTLARWLDYAAVLLMMGSLFWQTLLFGWRYALLLGAEGFLAFWWGSARRLRRFLYTGMMGVILATIAQLINSLWSVNQWIVFGLIGLLVVAGGLVVERKMEEIKAWQESLETWE